MLKAIKELIIPQKDYAGRSIDSVILGLSTRTGTSIYEWSYLHEEGIYQNTRTNQSVYPHEIVKKAM